MPLKSLGVIAIPKGLNSDFDHAAFDPKTRRVFVAHTACDCLEVIDHDRQIHIATLPGCPGIAGAVPTTGKSLRPIGPRPDGAAILKRRGIGRWKGKPPAEFDA